MNAHRRRSIFVLTSISLALFANDAITQTRPRKEPSPTMSEIVPIAIKKSFLEGKGLVKDDPSEYEDYTHSVKDENPEPKSQSSSHIFHHDKIHVSVIEAGPDKVRGEGLPYDEFVHIVMGRLILTLDDGRKFEFEQGDSFILPKGFVGIWEMPERYRELVVVDTEALPAP